MDVGLTITSGRKRRVEKMEPIRTDRIDTVEWLLPNRRPDHPNSFYQLAVRDVSIFSAISTNFNLRHVVNFFKPPRS
jgi:hypothetical protein